ncbi:MAG: phosphate regulon sensor histidine kinase PhoR [Limnohabitans sp.]|nr:phosphate regulon sensor histidine kinase PhoR [Limnohabitans sp.]
MLAAVSILHIYNLWQGSRLLEWLRRTELDANLRFSGVWGDTGDRILRLIKLKDNQRQASEESLRQLLAAVQASPHGVVILDSDSRIQWSNQTASRHLGLDPRIDVQQLIGNMLRSPAFSQYVHSKSFDHEVIIEGRLHRIDRPHKLGIQLFPYGDGRMLLLSRDVTLIEQAETMRRDFVANVSHEIRTPLTVLSGFIETLQTLFLNDSIREKYLILMEHQSNRLKSLVDDLLTLSRLEGSPFPGQRDWIAVADLFKSCEEEAQGLSERLHPSSKNRQKLAFQMHPDSLEDEIAGNKTELISAFSNLISNAIRYIPAGGQIRVKWTRTSDEAVFSVEDTGPGIAPEHFSRLSERFYRIDRSRSRDTGGTGLGLAIVKHVIQRHGGSLEIESKLNQGSKFSLHFPAARYRFQKKETVNQTESI